MPSAPLSSGAGRHLLRPEWLPPQALSLDGGHNRSMVGCLEPSTGPRRGRAAVKQSWKPWKPTGEGWREGQVEGLQTDSHALVWQSETLSESPPCRGLSMCHLSASCLCFPVCRKGQVCSYRSLREGAGPALCKLWGTAPRSGAIMDLLCATEQVGDSGALWIRQPPPSVPPPEKAGHRPLGTWALVLISTCPGSPDAGEGSSLCPEPSTMFVPPSLQFKMVFIVVPTSWGCWEH